MTPINEILLGIFLTALLGAIGWILSTFYKAFTNLILTVANAVLKLETTITKMDERWEAQNIYHGMQKESFEKESEDVRNEIGKVEERVDKVEHKLDKHIEKHQIIRKT